MRGFLKTFFTCSVNARASVIALCLAVALSLTLPGESAGASRFQDLSISAGFEGRTVLPDEAIELTLSRPLSSGEGRLAVTIGSTDLTDLFIATGNSLGYSPKPFSLPAGESELTVYLVAPNGEWKAIASFKLIVAAQSLAGSTENLQASNSEQAAPTSQTPTADGSQAATQTQPPAESGIQRFGRRLGFDKFDLLPALNIGFKSQFAETHFPDANRPERPEFADATIQGTWKSEMARGAMQMQQQFDIVGSSLRNEALRFGELGANARKIELSSYQMQFQHGTRQFSIGHSSFGAQRHLINNFSSRGFTVTLPISKHLDASLVSMNSTNIVGFDNFFGVSNRRHSLHGGVLGLEVFSKRPGGLRFEAGAIDAWFLANRQNFNQGNINDSERSKGLSFRVLAKDKSERARLDAGFTRSQFFNPNDPLLNQNAANVIQSRAVTRNARYADASFDLLKNFSFVVRKPAATQTGSADAANQQIQDAQSPETAIESKKLSLTLNIRHERIDPLFRSIGAASQADLQQNVVEFVGAFGDLNFTAAYTRFNDNLAGIQSILRTNTRREAFAINTPLQNLFRLHPAVVPNPFLPRIGYSFDRTRAFADFIPIGGGFDQPGAIPDQANINQAFTAEWQFKEFRIAYQLNHTFQDNRAISRERADLQNFVHAASFGWNPLAALELNFDMNFEDANNREQAATNRNLRFGFNVNWIASSRQTINATFATNGAGDLARTNDSRNSEFDLQWNYRLTREVENRFRKVQMIYFIRYSNRFARTRNFLEDVNSLTKLNTFNTGLNFTFF